MWRPDPSPDFSFPAHPPHRTDIDGLRAFAVLAVVLFHGALIPGGYIGVDVFFVISGYLMASIVQQGLGAGTFSFLEFYARRARRIFPAFVVVLALVGILGCFLMLPADVRNLGRSIASAAQFQSNFYFYDSERGYFTANAVQFEPLLHTWSLSVEIQFYLIFPFLLWAVDRYARRYGPIILGVLIALSLGLSQHMLFGDAQYSFYMLPSRMWELLVGALIFYLPPLHRGRMAAFALAVLMLFGSALRYDENMDFPGLAAIPPVLGACLILLARPGRGTQDGILFMIFGNPVTAWLANLSYSFYLWHWPLFVYARYNYGEVLPVWASIALLAVSLGCAALTYRFVEKPFLRAKPSVKRTLYIQFTMLLCLFLVGVILRYALSNVVQRALPENVLVLYNGRDDMLRRDCQPYKANCLIGDLQSPPSFILWGDSFARMWLPAFEAQARKRHVSGIQSVRSACSPANSINGRRQEECRKFNEETLEYILSHKELKTVVLAANWQFSEPMKADIADIAGKLAVDGRRVYFILPPPRPGYQVPRALAISELRGFPRPVLQDAEDYKRRSDIFLDAFESIGEKDGLQIIELDNVICPENKCLVEKNGKALYADAFHLSGFGVLTFSHALDGLFRDLERKRP